MSEAWPNTFDEGYIYHFQPEPTHKVHEKQQKHWVQRNSAMEHLLNDLKDHPNEHENSHKQCDKTRHHVVNMIKSQSKLRQQHDQNFPVERKAIVEQILVLKERNGTKKAGLWKLQSWIWIGK